jgi:hypothetical protein
MLQNKRLFRSSHNRVIYGNAMEVEVGSRLYPPMHSNRGPEEVPGRPIPILSLSASSSRTPPRIVCRVQEKQILANWVGPPSCPRGTTGRCLRGYVKRRVATSSVKWLRQAQGGYQNENLAQIIFIFAPNGLRGGKRPRRF